MLTFKEAVRTSVLSKSWRFIWTNHPDLLLDSSNILGAQLDMFNCQLELDRQLERCKFIERVDHLMHQRQEGPKINSLAIHFQLGKKFSSRINHWISCAVTKGVENVNLDLSECSSSKGVSVPSEQYTFPCWLLAAPGKRCTVKHLKLASCSLSSLPGSNNLSSLITVELRDVNISDQQLENFLSTCLFLERLSLHLCKDLVNFKITGPSFRLKLLSIQNCFRLARIEIDAENLAMLEYIGPFVTFSFKDVPRLAEVFFCFTNQNRLEGVTYALTRFAYDVHQVETLNLVSVLALKILKLPRRVPSFTNIKKLMLTVFPFHDEDKLCWISYILKAFPLMCKLELNLFSPNFIKQSRKIERRLPKCPHGHLKELEINGFHGNQHEVELLEYLLDNVVALEVLMINQRENVYKGFDSQHQRYEVICSWHKMSVECFEFIRALVPQTVSLNIQ